MRKPAIDRISLANALRFYAQKRKDFKAVLRLIQYDYDMSYYLRDSSVLKRLEYNYEFLRSIEEEKRNRYAYL